MKRVVVLNDTSANRHPGSRLVMTRIAQLAADNHLTITARSMVGADWQAEPQTVAAMRQADLILVNGEGTLHVGKTRALPLVKAASFGREHGIPTALINAIYYGNGPEFDAHVAQFDRIYVRDGDSLENLRTLGIVATLVPDLTLSTPVLSSPGQRHGIMVTDSNLPEAVDALFSFARADGNASFVSFLSPPSLADGWRVNVAYYLFRTWYSAAWRLMPPSSARARVYTGAVGEWTRVLTQVASSSLVVAGRFHAACFALLTRTPVIGIRSSSAKIEAMFKDVGLSHRIVEPADLVPERIEHFSKFTPDELRSIEQFVDSAFHGAHTMFDDLTNLAYTKKE
jgi:polysaccharide pyruvyl transferase WcaK-like protein